MMTKNRLINHHLDDHKNLSLEHGTTPKTCLESETKISAENARSHTKSEVFRLMHFRSEGFLLGRECMRSQILST